jgi:hypothetical protein
MTHDSPIPSSRYFTVHEADAASAREHTHVPVESSARMSLAFLHTTDGNDLTTVEKTSRSSSVPITLQSVPSFLGAIEIAYPDFSVVAGEKLNNANASDSPSQNSGGHIKTARAQARQRSTDGTRVSKASTTSGHHSSCARSRATTTCLPSSDVEALQSEHGEFVEQVRMCLVADTNETDVTTTLNATKSSSRPRSYDPVAISVETFIGCTALTRGPIVMLLPNEMNIEGVGRNVSNRTIVRRDSRRRHDASKGVEVSRRETAFNTAMSTSVFDGLSMTNLTSDVTSTCELFRGVAVESDACENVRTVKTTQGRSLNQGRDAQTTTCRAHGSRESRRCADALQVAFELGLTAETKKSARVTILVNAT